MTSRELGLDHFLFYDTVDHAQDESIRIQTQFDEEMEPVRVRGTRYFANPVSKNGEGIVDPNAHLTWWVMHDPVPDPMRVVNYTDQFGRRRVYLGRKVALLTPTHKSRRGGKFPERLDHYVAFQVLDSTTVNKSVKLKDQWGADSAKVYYPVLFAAPARKWHAGRISEISNKAAHLAIYRINPTSVEKQAKTRDQFGARITHAFRRVLLGVPCKKGKWEAQD